MYEDTANVPRSAFRTAQRNSIPYWIAAGAPVLPARQTARCGGFAMWAVWCEHCQAEHRHGGDELPAHRIAPCTVPGSPYRERGYVLVDAEAGAVAA